MTSKCWNLPYDIPALGVFMHTSCQYPKVVIRSRKTVIPFGPHVLHCDKSITCTILLWPQSYDALYDAP